METKYKILLGLYVAFMTYFMLVVPWRDYHGNYYNALIFAQPAPSSSVDFEWVLSNLFRVNVGFGVIYLLLSKIIFKQSKS